MYNSITLNNLLKELYHKLYTSKLDVGIFGQEFLDLDR
jgi:hypothetical protein